MASFFGRSKKKAAEDASAEAYAASIKSVHGALGKLHDAIDKLDKRQALLEKRVAGIIVEARTKLQAKDKEGAKLCLKRKALWTKQLGSLGGQKFSLEAQIAQIEETSLNETVFLAIERAAKTLKEMQQRLPVERVEKLLESTAEAMERAHEVADAMQTISDEQAAAFDVDDDVMEEELEALLAPPAEAKPAPAPAPESTEADALAELARQLEGLPAPGDAPAMTTAEADAELAALEAAMA